MEHPTPGFLKRQRVWYHNGLRGRVAMAYSAMIAILNTDSASAEAKDIAAELVPKLRSLQKAIERRIDP